MTTRIKAVLAAQTMLLALFICPPSAADNAIPKDATVGLVLSGGGARGLAHAGVLHVLEANGIEPHIITGTSMGAIIGALYASGRSATEIDRIARTMNWQHALSDTSPREDQPYPFRKLESGMSTDLRMSITRQGIAFPKGAIEGQHLEQTLSDLFTQNGKPLLFDDMPKRFAAVAADLETGQAVVMNSGDVASAVRASMSIPGAIAPVERDGRLLVDGGIANNMPVALARQMGADFIIAVDVSAPLKTREGLTSLFDIAQQVTNLMVRNNTQKQIELLRPKDVLIVPPLDGYSSMAFNQDAPIINAGFLAALDVFGFAKQDVPASTAATTPLPASPPRIDFIRIINDSVISDNVMREQIHQPLGKPLDRELIERDLSRLYSLDYFSVVRYRVVEKNRQTGLEITGRGRDTGNSWLKLGLELADDFEGNSVVQLTASLRSAGLNQYGGTAFTRLSLGTVPEVELRYIQPLTPSLEYFVEPAIGYKADLLEFYPPEPQSEPVAKYRKEESWASLSLGRSLWDGAGEFRLGLTRKDGHLEFHSGQDLGLEEDHYSDGYYFGQVGWDTLDELGFPSSGYSWTFRAQEHRHVLEARDDFTRLEIDGTYAYTRGRNTWLFEGDAEMSDDDKVGFIDSPFIGGFLELSGLPPRSRFGRHRALIRTVYYHRLDKHSPLPIDMPLYAGFSLERGNVWLNRDDISWKNSIAAGSLFLGARTPLGPAYLIYGKTEEGDTSWSIFLGQRFR